MGIAFCGCKNQAGKIIVSDYFITPLPEITVKKNKTTSYKISLENTNNSKLTNQNKNQNQDSIKTYLNKEIEFDQKQITLLTSNIRGFLFRKNYNESLKTELLDHTNELYFEFISLLKYKKSFKIINNNNNENLKKILKTNWEEFYEKDPILNINSKISEIKKYKNGLIFKYKNKNVPYTDINQCLSNIESCYKGSVDLYTNLKCGYGELFNLDGILKIGTFYNDLFNGWNQIIDDNGNIYIGLCENDYLNGKGIIYNSDNNYIYKGEINNLNKNGKGIEIFDDNIFEGIFMNNMKLKGDLKFKNGDIYKGSFSNDKFNGAGKYIWEEKNKEYTGNFLDGKIHGDGLMIYEGNKYYKGMYNNGIKEGKGEFGYLNGDKYCFNFKDGIPNGKGIKIDKKGRKYEIFYINGKIICKATRDIVMFSFENDNE